MKHYEGGCLCGHIRFVATGTPGWPDTCSCSICQRHSGALTLAWVEFPRDQVQWTGPGDAPQLWRSSPKSSRAFCPVCGSTLGVVDDALTIALLVGNLDRPNRKDLAPVAHSYISSRPKWWRIGIGADPA